MRTRTCGTSFVMAWAVFLMGLAALPVRAGSLADTGEVKLIGTIKSVNRQQHTFVLKASGYADENSEAWTVFGAARPKTVKAPGKICYVYAKGIGDGTIDFARLRVGTPVIVAASAKGTSVGKSVMATSVGLFVKGNAFDLAAYKSALSGDAPQNSGSDMAPQSDATGDAAPPAVHTIFSLNKTLGKDFAAYEVSIGKPETRKDYTNGGIRTYKSAALLAKGVAKIELDSSYGLIKGNIHAVTSSK